MDKLRTSFYLLFIFCFLATACVPATPIPLPTPEPSHTPTFTPTVAPTFTPMPTRTPVAITPTLDPPAIIRFCSPLRELAFDDIQNVIRGTFEAPDAISGTMYRDNGHHGIDIGYFNYKGLATIMGAPVQATLDGEVVSITHNRKPYGNSVIIETTYENIPLELREKANIPEGYSLYHLYAHLRDIEPLIVGQAIECGTLLGHAGKTGTVTGAHLHFETRYGPPGAVFPGGMAFYIGDVTESEWKNYIEWRMSGTYRLFDPMLFMTMPVPLPTPSTWTIAP